MKQHLIIIPGWGGTKASWQKFVDLASVDFDLHFISLPCSDDLPCPEKVWGVDEYAEFVKKEILKLKLENPILLGHSFGGQISVNLIANNPALVSKLILSGAAILRPGYVLKRMFFSAIAKVGKFIFKLPLLGNFEQLAKKVIYKTANSPDYENTLGLKREIFKKVIRQNQKDSLAKIKLPTLIVWGSDDKYVPLKEGKAIAGLISGSELKIIKGGKHGLHIQQPDNLLKIIKEYIEKQ